MHRVRRSAFLVVSLLGLAAGLPFSQRGAAEVEAGPRPKTVASEGRVLNPRLLALEPNTWSRLAQAEHADWRRQTHAGIAYDSKRGTLLVFGSNTHGLDWDNEIHEFDPAPARWKTHYPRAPKTSYRADAGGRAVAGTDRLLPWAMHTYDNIVYDPRLDAIVVSALPEHNPIRKNLPEAKIHPTWIYDLKTRQWRIFENIRCQI